MALRIAFDIDGVLADLESAYKEVVERLFEADESGNVTSDPGGVQAADGDEPEEGVDVEELAEVVEDVQPSGVWLTERQERQIWREIEATPDFWLSLKPHEESALERLRTLSIEHRWEIFFVTQRPSTAGDTVQRQTQRWLIEHGFDMPSVMVLTGSRGKVADALHLDFIVDDSPKHCTDVISESDTQPVLILRHEDPAGARSAKRLGIQVTSSVSEALDLLERAHATKANPGLFRRLAKGVGLGE